MPGAPQKLIVNPHDDILKYAKQQNAIRKQMEAERAQQSFQLRDRKTRVAHMLGRSRKSTRRKTRRSKIRG
jgi:hypothetical protein